MSEENKQYNEALQDLIMSLTINQGTRNFNPGAVSALVTFAKTLPFLDNSSDQIAILCLNMISGWGVTGPGIWGLWSDNCGCDPWRFALLIRGIQNGVIPQVRWEQAAAGHLGGLLITKEEWDKMEEHIGKSMAGRFITHAEWLEMKDLLAILNNER